MTAVTSLGTQPISCENLVEGYVQGRFDYVLKYATLDEEYLLWHMAEGLNPRNTFAKIRCWFYAKGDDPCANMGWHVDMVADTSETPFDEVHRIWVSNTPPEFENYGRIREQEIFEYGRNLHRARPIEEDGWRLFLRVSETATKSMQNRKVHR